MLYSSLLVAAATLCGLVSAQNFSIQGGNYTVTPSSVPEFTREQWCNAQKGGCPLICGGPGNVEPLGNECYTTTLTYQCTCKGGNQPNVSDYANTLPSLMCIQYVKDCVKAAGNSLNSLTKCRSVVCGTKDPGKVPQSGSGTGSSSSAAPSQSASGTGGSGNSPSPTSGGGAAASSSNAAVALAVMGNYGTSILAGGMLAIFGLAL